MVKRTALVTSGRRESRPSGFASSPSRLSWTSPSSSTAGVGADNAGSAPGLPSSVSGAPSSMLRIPRPVSPVITPAYSVRRLGPAVPA
jgi:hypothetical protein